MTKTLLRRLPFVLILVAAGLGLIFLRHLLDLDALARNRDALLAFRDAHYPQAVAVFLLAYVAIVALSLPGATVATLTGGFLFGLFPGVVFNVLAAGTGAILVYLAARAGLGAEVSARIAASGGAAARLQTGLQRNVWSALLTMRLVPAVPFFVSNLLPAFTGVPLWPFAVTTYLGIIPGGLVFTSVGAGLSDVFAKGGQPELGSVLTPGVLLPLLGLAALSALPLVLRAFQRKED